MGKPVHQGTHTESGATSMARPTLSEIDGQLRMDAAPVLPPTCPLFRNIHHCQIQHFQQTAICRENALGFCNLPQLPIKAFDRVRGMDTSSTSVICFSSKNSIKNFVSAR